MKFNSQIIAEGSGSVAGCVFSRNRYGPYIRNRSIPTNPNSSFQQTVRANFSLLATAWNVDLDASERAAWDNYAALVPRVDSLGNAIFTTGLNWYIAVNSLRLNQAIARLDAAPVIFNMTGLAPVALNTADVSSQNLSVGFTATDEWNADDGFLFVFMGRPQNESHTFFKGPFRFAALLAGDTAIPLTSPQLIAPIPFVIGLDQRVYMRVIATSPDGRISTPQIDSVIATA
jgi:hypothetical protein